MPDVSSRLLLMANRELRPCWTFCPAGFNTNEVSDKENKNDHWYLPGINWEKMSDRDWKCLAECWRSIRHFVWLVRNNFHDHWAIVNWWGNFNLCVTRLRVRVILMSHHAKSTSMHRGSVWRDPPPPQRGLEPLCWGQERFFGVPSTLGWPWGLVLVLQSRFFGSGNKNAV